MNEDQLDRAIRLTAEALEALKAARRNGVDHSRDGRIRLDEVGRFEPGTDFTRIPRLMRSGGLGG